MKAQDDSCPTARDTRMPGDICPPHDPNNPFFLLEQSMKKYLGIAALLGVIAFVSVSILAQAEPQDRLPAPQNAPAQTAAGQNAPPNKNMSETAASDDAASAATPRDALQKLVAITPAAGKAAK
jgi:hypothetical protein